MITYNSQWLDNRDIQQQAQEALAAGVITRPECDRIKEAYPCKFYTPNLFIRGGLFLLTLLAVACGLGLFMLMAMGGGDRAFGFILIFWGLASYAALEFFIRVRRFYRAGVDDALLWLAGGLVFGGISWLSQSLSPVLAGGIVFVLAAWGVFRYADRLMGLVGHGALIYLIFHLLTGTGYLGTTLLPFIVMAVSIVSCFLCVRLSDKASWRHYRGCLSILRMAALVSFYLSGNYYIIQHISASIHGDAAPIALSWLWWSFTVIVPVAYLIGGVKQKDVILLWTGMALVAGAVFTIRYYHHLLSTEWAMIAGGSILVIGAYALIRYLQRPKCGFTSAAPAQIHPLQHLPIEGMIVAETFQSIAAPPINQTNSFGGGSGGGGGASGTY